MNAQQVDLAIRAQMEHHLPVQPTGHTGALNVTPTTSCQACGDLWPCQYIIQASITMLSCVQVYGSNDSKRRVAWINPTAISSFTEYESYRREGQPLPLPRWTLVSMTNGEQLAIDASPEQFAGWLRGDRPRILSADQAAIIQGDIANGKTTRQGERR